MAQCGPMYATAISEYSREAGRSQWLQKIYFVECDQQKFDLLVDIFNQMLPKSVHELLIFPENYSGDDEGNAPVAYDSVPGARRSDSRTHARDSEKAQAQYEDIEVGSSCEEIPSQDEYQQDFSRSKTLSVENPYRISDQCTLEINVKDIRNAEVDAIVCPELVSLPRGGAEASAIKITYRKWFKVEKLRKVAQESKVATTECDSALGRVKYLLHVSVPLCYRVGDAETVQLERSIKSVFSKLARFPKRDIGSIAMPLFGVGG